MILFAGVTAEEQGLLGSEYLGKHSPVPPGRISLDLNYDALAPIGDPEEMEVSGAERTTFFPAAEEKAKSFGLAIQPDAPKLATITARIISAWREWEFLLFRFRKD